MSKAEIIKQIAEKMYGNVNDKSIQQSTAFCDTLEEIIKNALLDLSLIHISEPTRRS